MSPLSAPSPNPAPVSINHHPLCVRTKHGPPNEQLTTPQCARKKPGPANESDPWPRRSKVLLISVLGLVHPSPTPPPARGPGVELIPGCSVQTLARRASAPRQAAWSAEYYRYSRRLCCLRNAGASSCRSGPPSLSILHAPLTKKNSVAERVTLRRQGCCCLRRSRMTIYAHSGSSGVARRRRG